jgi:2-amino-4-hydroxy-6-hydroxymethyldihydropteridine diphosphokinase
MGDRYALLCAALTHLQHVSRTEVVAVSSIYETAPWGYEEQAAFLNGVAQVRTDLPPHNLLLQLLRIETQLGRQRTIHWGPRLIDLDLLLYDDVTCDTADLILPHPRLTRRLFVLVPLAELDASIRVAGKCVSEHIADLEQESEEGTIKRWGPPPQYADAVFA